MARKSTKKEAEKVKKYVKKDGFRLPHGYSTAISKKEKGGFLSTDF